ncbi:MAG: polymorphic toxin-type HINT domain-containing protein, partial [Gemmataceae bacterium]
TAHAAAEVIALFNPCGLVAKGLSAYSLYENVSDMVQNGFTWSNVIGAGLSVLGLFGACFTGDMLLLSREGKKRAEAIREGDLLWSRDEFDPDGPLVLKRVLRVFERTARIWHVRVPGQVLRTTVEHPFWVENRQSWLSVGELHVGDVVRTDGGELLPVEAIENSGKWERVYNWEIEDYHTYFVSASEDGASIWAHNAKCTTVGKAGEKGARGILRGLGHKIVGSIQNASGHGIDLITRKGGELFFWEVKGSQIGRFKLSPAQARGVDSFVKSRLDRAARGLGSWRGLNPRIADKARYLLDEIKATGGKARGGVIFFPNLFSGKGSTVQIQPWLPPKP